MHREILSGATDGWGHAKKRAICPFLSNTEHVRLLPIRRVAGRDFPAGEHEKQDPNRPYIKRCEVRVTRTRAAGNLLGPPRPRRLLFVNRDGLASRRPGVRRRVTCDPTMPAFPTRDPSRLMSIRLIRIQPTAA